MKRWIATIGVLASMLLLSAGLSASPCAAQGIASSESSSDGEAQSRERASPSVAEASTTPTARRRSSPSDTPDGATEPVVDPLTNAPSSDRAEGSTPAGARPTGSARESEGDGRDVDYIWLEAQGGISYVNLIQFQNTNFADVASGDSIFRDVYGTGPVVGVGVGFRLWWIAVGARGSFAIYETFQLGTVGGEVTLRLPVPVVEPWVRVGFGYGWQGNAQYQRAEFRSASTTTYGWVFQSGLGLDVYLVQWLTLGAALGIDIVNMSRQRDPTVSCMGVTDICPGRNGDALGFQIRGLATVGLRF